MLGHGARVDTAMAQSTTPSDGEIWQRSTFPGLCEIRGYHRGLGRGSLLLAQLLISQQKRPVATASS